MTVYTIGHSTRPLDELVDILKGFFVKELVDVRTIPRSRFNPQFNLENLSKELPGRGIGYRHMPGLGGLRRPKKDSVNLGWRNASFRGYADYMQTREFEQNLEDLVKLARKKRVAIMCAEAVPWRCHRSLIADNLTARGVEVKDIMGPRKDAVHKINPMAKVGKDGIRYPLELFH